MDTSGFWARPQSWQRSVRALVVVGSLVIASDTQRRCKESELSCQIENLYNLFVLLNCPLTTDHGQLTTASLRLDTSAANLRFTLLPVLKESKYDEANRVYRAGCAVCYHSSCYRR
jgi:hypothetical protein